MAALDMDQLLARLEAYPAKTPRLEKIIQNLHRRLWPLRADLDYVRRCIGPVYVEHVRNDFGRNRKTPETVRALRKRRFERSVSGATEALAVLELPKVRRGRGDVAKYR